MIFTITISIAGLVFINLLLLKFSCNKTPKQTKVVKRPIVISPRLTILPESEQLAPTGS